MGEYLPLRSPLSNSSAKSLMREKSCGSSGLVLPKVFGDGRVGILGFRRLHERLVGVDLRPIVVVRGRGQMRGGDDRQNAAGGGERGLDFDLGVRVVELAAPDAVGVEIFLPIPPRAQRRRRRRRSARPVSACPIRAVL